MASRAVKGAWRRFERVLDGVAAVERWIAAALLAVVLVVAVLQVLSRYVLNTPMATSDEVARFALIWATFIAAALTQHRDQHIAVLILRKRGGPRQRVALQVLANVIALLTGVFICYLGIETLTRSARVSSPSLEIPMSLVYLGVVLGFALIALHSLRNVRNLIVVGRTRGDHLEDEMQLT